MAPSLVPPPQRTTLTQCVEHCDLEARVSALEHAQDEFAAELRYLRTDVSQVRLDVRTLAEQAERRHGEQMRATADLTEAVIRFLDSTNALRTETLSRLAALDARLEELDGR